MLEGLVVICALVFWFFWDSITSFVSKSFQKKNFAVELFWSPPGRAGETVKFRVWILKKTQDEAVIQSIIDGVSVEIKQRETVISTIKEIVFPDNERQLTAIDFKFSVRVAGEYRIKILYCRRNIEDSPMKVEFVPADIDPFKTSFLRTSPLITCVHNSAHDFEILPKDRFDNKICQLSNVSFSDFDFICRLADDGQNNNIKMSDFLTYNFQESYLERVILRVRFNACGVFYGKIIYKGKVIHHGEFTIVVLTKEENMNLATIISSNPSWHPFEGRLLARGFEVMKSNRNIFMYVSPTVLYVREYILKIFPIKVANFRLSTMTKIDILIMNSEDGTYTFTITDKIQPSITIEMKSPICRVVMAMYAHYLSRKIGGTESFECKQRFFSKNLREANLDIRLTSKVIKISRSDLVESSYRATKAFRGRDWCKNFRVEFKNEPGVDGGGLKREWLNILCAALFDNKAHGLFCAAGENSRLVHPNPAQRRGSQWKMYHYQMAGYVVGKCLFETACGGSHQQMVNGRFSRSFLAQLIGLPTSYRFFEQDDPGLWIGKVKYILENDVESMELTFSEEEYREDGKLLKVVDLIPNGSKIAVTNENKEEYLNLLANYRLSVKVHEEIEAFLKGLHEICPDDLLSNFDENELEVLMCGKSEFDVDDLRKNYISASWGWDNNSKKILDWFWTAISNMDDDEKARLLQFTTGSSLLPSGGFKSLDPKFNISFSGRIGSLPTAQTCVNRICLSDHYTFELFESSLRLAINEGCEGYGFA